MAETIELQSTFYVMAFVMSDDSRSVVSQIGIAPVIEGKIDNADLYYEESNGTDCPSFIEEWSSLEFILREEQVVISSKQGLQTFRNTLNRHKISMPIIPHLVDASQILPIEDIEQTASMATDARSLATLLAFKLMPKKQGEKVESVDATINNPFFGKIFVITGKVFEHDRDDIAHFLKLLGAHQRKSISSITNFILTGDNPGYAKLRQAKEYYEAGKDITRISYTQILEIVRLCRPYVEKKVFHKEVDEQEFIDKLNQIVQQAKNDANFSDSAVNYAALATEKYKLRNGDRISYVGSENKSYFTEETIVESQTERNLDSSIAVPQPSEEEKVPAKPTAEEEAEAAFDAYYEMCKRAEREREAAILARIEAEERQREEEDRRRKEILEQIWQQHQAEEARKREEEARRRAEQELADRRRAEQAEQARLKREAEEAEREAAQARRDRRNRWLKPLATMAAASVALLVIWNTGLLIPLGLIGLAMSGIIKLK